MMTKTLWISAALAGLALASPALYAADSVLPSAGLANPLGNSSGSARSMAMGSAPFAVADGTDGILGNPAGLASLDAVRIDQHHNTWLMGIDQESLLVGFGTKELGGLALAGTYVDFGTMEGRDSLGFSTGDYHANRWGMDLGWGQTYWKTLSFGLSGGWRQEAIAKKTYITMSGSAGLAWTPSSSLKFGLAGTNFGTAKSGAAASKLIAGASYALGSLLAAVGGSFEPEGDSAVQAGLELGVKQSVFFRGGYSFPLTDAHLEGLSGATAGLGVRAGGFVLDYAFLPFGNLGNSHRLSLGYQFGADKAATP